ncbi:MAG: polyprenyl synthetase family protein [Patescibacteria group bacterium]
MEELRGRIKQKRREGAFEVLSEIDKVISPKVEELLELGVENKFKPLIKYQTSTGGKKLRAALVMLGCLGCGGDEKDSVYPAAAMEILHNNTLMVDDIIDHSTWRRRKFTTWKKYGSSVTQCLTFIYSASVFQAAAHARNSKALTERFAVAFKTVLQGEINDLLLEQAGRENEKYIQKNRCKNVGLDDYLEMISQKTASLIAISSEVGGVCADTSDPRIKALRGYGYNLGMAFQIRDDILDIYGDEAKFGKRIGQDIYERKLGNILIIYALEEFDKEAKQKFLNILQKDKITEGDVNKAIKMIKRTGAQKKATELAGNYSSKGYENLKKLPQNQYNGVLKDLLDFVIKRDI